MPVDRLTARLQKAVKEMGKKEHESECNVNFKQLAGLPCDCEKIRQHSREVNDKPV